MKQKLLLICVCLFGALSGVKAWTSVTPQVGKSYYLLSTEFNQFWYASGTPLGENRYYGVTSDIAAATPIYVETAGDNYAWTFSFYIGGEKWFINQNDGNTYLYKSGSKFQIWANGDGNYYLRTQEYRSGGKTYRHYLNAESASGTCNFPGSSEHYCEWQFIAAEEAMTSMSTFCAGVAGANYVQSAKGWEKVTSISELQTNPEDYFFAIFSANAAGLMVQTNASTGHGYYLNGTNPLSNSAYLFNIENYSYNSEDYFVMKAGNTNAYYHAENNAAYDLVAKDQPSVDDDCRLVFEYADNAWNIKTWTSYSGDLNSGSYWGLWTPGEGYMNGKKMAGNKNDAEKGSFLIYRIPRYKLDMTSRITNPSFETDDDGHVGATGWTLGSTNNDTKVHLNSNPTYTMSNVDGDKLFNTWDGDGTGYTISQTLSNMPAGVYKLTAVMGAFEGQTLQLIANDVTGTAPSEGKETGVKVTTYVTLASPGNLTIQAKTAASAFYKVDNFRLTYIASSLTEDLTAASGIMNAAVNTAQQNAVSLYNSNKTVTNYIAAMDAIAAAEDSKAAYAEADIEGYRSRMGELLATTNVYTAEAYNKWYANVETNYAAGLYTDEEVVTLTAAGACQGAAETEHRKANRIDDVLLSTWTFGGEQCSDYSKSLYINTWSTEGNDDGSGFQTPFFEYWTSDANSLGEATMASTMTGLDASTEYSLDIWARVRQTNGQTKVDNSITLQLNNGAAVDLTQGTQIGDFYLKHFKAYGRSNESGNLTITINVASGSNISWLSFKDLMLETKTSVTVSARAGKYGTIILPFAYDFAGDGDFSNIKFYSCASVNNSYTQIEEVSTPAANTPYIIKNNGGSDFSKTISGFSVAEESSYTVGLLTGVYTDAYIPMSDGSNSYYVLQTKDDVQAFYKVEDADFPGTPYKCYLTIPTATPVKAFLFPENPTAINAIEAAENENTEIYNLAGQRMSKVQKGVNIINGKKVLVK